MANLGGPIGNPYQDVGGLNDTVRLRFGGDELMIAESWDVAESVLAAPSVSSVTVGLSQPLGPIFTQDPSKFGQPKYPKGTPVQLFIGDALQSTGRIEGYKVTGAASRITIQVRDALAPLMVGHVPATKSFLNGTYTELVLWALEAAGYDKKTLVLRSSNAADRPIKAGIPITSLSEPVTIDSINASGVNFSTQTGTAGIQGGVSSKGVLVGQTVAQRHQARITESLLHFLRRHLDRAGLFLWSASDGSFVLSQPNGNQKPMGRIVRTRSAVSSVEQGNVVDVDFTDSAMSRHTGCTVYGRGGGGKAGRTKAIGSAVDLEMTNLGYLQPLLCRDVNVSNVQQAEFYARRKLAEERRDGWSLTYTISGHRILPIHKGDTPGVVTIDTTVHVKDDQLGLDDNYYVESVRRIRRPETVTQVRLMRLQDLIFGTGGID